MSWSTLSAVALSGIRLEGGRGSPPQRHVASIPYWHGIRHPLAWSETACLLPKDCWILKKKNFGKKQHYVKKDLFLYWQSIQQLPAQKRTACLVTMPTPTRLFNSISKSLRGKSKKYEKASFQHGHSMQHALYGI